MNIVVLDGFAADQGQLTWDGLSPYGAVTVHPRTAAEDLLARARDAEALLTNKVVLDGETIERLPKLRYVGILATGTNVVSLSACRAQGIAVTNVPGYGTHSVAELVFALLLHLTRDVAGHDGCVKGGGWASSPDFSFSLRPMTELSGKTLTVVGMGAIGRVVANVASAFGMRVLAAKVPGSPSTDRVPLDDALPESDVVTLHCPLTLRTRHLVGPDFLHKVKKGAVLINTGRGALIDERALLSTLSSGKLGGVALDVLDREPPPADHPLLDPRAPWAPRLIVTPHIGWATLEARERLIATAAANLGAFVRGEELNRVEQMATLDAAPPPQG